MRATYSKNMTRRAHLKKESCKRLCLCLMPVVDGHILAKLAYSDTQCVIVIKHDFSLNLKSSITCCGFIHHQEDAHVTCRNLSA